MTLSNQQRDALYSYVASLFTESVNDRRDASAVDALASDIASVTHKALGDAVEAWNRTACSAMCRLPMELLAHSFSWLNLTDRAKVTAVSRYFRSVALGDPSLWAQIELDQKTPHLMITDTLALLLERSGRVPLDVHIYPQNEDVAALLAPHISRIRTLILDKTHDTSWILAPTQDISWIFEQPAPILELVKVPPVRHLQTVLPLPAWAPLLRRLELPSTFVLPVSSSGHFDRVTYFSGWMTTDFAADTDASRLFNVFPSLKILQLSFTKRYTSVDYLPNTRVPSTLEEITLHDDGDGLNIPALLALWHGHSFRVVNLHSIYTPLAMSALEHMRSVASGPWRLDLLVEEKECELRTQDEAVYKVNCYDRYAGFHEVRGFLGTLGSIVAPASVFLHQLTELFNMPSLRSVTLYGAFPWTFEEWEVFDGVLCVPQLQALRLEPAHHAEERWQAGELQDCSRYTEELFRRFTLENGSELPKVPRLVFSEVARPYVGEEYWAWIYQRASSVYIEDELLWQEETDN
ncbi:hypothetical protein EXIGLDRAFT_845209 [Exidia glandulosa HHB12029]|uniref:F-box domain-containing protein n=1 Tax=Exidia glandulosa HHB12029 TaxID=1314781 RepID=A0A165BKX4_EXIGL|nr:hypothetical protein EXIGLDRAFT_845209 [Exidia glandulosa HHB12029]